MVGVGIDTVRRWAWHPTDAARFAGYDRCRPMLLTKLFRAMFFVGAMLSPVAIQAGTPVITHVVAPDPGTYNRSLSLNFTVVFSEPVVMSGMPRLPLVVGAATRYATVTPALDAAPSGARAIMFSYLPEADDVDADGIVVSSELALNGGVITALDGTPAGTALAMPDTSRVRVDVLRPPAPAIYGFETSAAGRELIVKGTADAESTVTLMLADSGVIGTTLAAPNGAWSLALDSSGFRPGTYRLTAQAENSAGILSASSAPAEVTIEHGAATARRDRRVR